jgi:hypothetical protein
VKRLKKNILLSSNKGSVQNNFTLLRGTRRMADGANRPLKVNDCFGSFPAVQPILITYTLSLWAAPEYEGLSSTLSGHSANLIKVVTVHFLDKTRSFWLTRFAECWDYEILRASPVVIQKNASSSYYLSLNIAGNESIASFYPLRVSRKKNGSIRISQSKIYKKSIICCC